MLSLFDLAALLVLSIAVALGIRRGANFALAAVVALVLYLLLARFFPPFFLPILAGGLGFAAATGAHYLPLPHLSPALEAAIGGIGGFFWGAFLALTIWVSFPSEFVASSGTLRYPSSQLPIWVQESITNSPFARPLFDWASTHTLMQSALLPKAKE